MEARRRKPCAYLGSSSPAPEPGPPAAKRRTPSQNAWKLGDRFLPGIINGPIFSAHWRFACPAAGQPTLLISADPPTCTASASSSQVPQTLSCAYPFSTDFLAPG